MPRTASRGTLSVTGRPVSAPPLGRAPSPVYSMGVYSIGSVASMLEVPRSTLRTWEERYGVISPHRTSGGHRLYTREQVEQLRHILAGIAAGASPADAHRALAQRISGSGSRHARLHQTAEILVAERDQRAGKLLEDLLRPDGFDVELTLDVDAAKRSFELNRQELSIVEFLMPAGGGEALCRWLKEQVAPAVLVVSELDVPARAIGAGADAFLRKPFGHTSLRAVVGALLGIDAIPAEWG